MNKKLIEIYKRNIEKRTGLKLEFLNPNDNYKINKEYYCGYWNQTYKVLDYKIIPNHWMGFMVKCLWQNGSTTTHCTQLRYDSDFLVVS